MRLPVAVLATLALLLPAAPAAADEGGLDERTGVALDIPLVDLPFNSQHGLTWPSMGQALGLSSDFYQLVHHGVGKLVDPYDPVRSQAILGRVAIVVADALATNLPGGLIWAHNEGQRAVLGRNDISSRNDIYRFRLFDPTVYVSRVSDDDLRGLKQRSPADFVRRSTAGLEMNLELVTAMQKSQLFYATRTWNQGLYWQSYLLVTGYQYLCASGRADRITRDADRSGDEADPMRRDVSGLDCLAWTRDQFRPGEPYDVASRGRHASGVGIERYTANRDLTTRERGHVNMMAGLSLLNFLDPALVGIDAFNVRVGSRQQPLRFNGHVRHTPTAYGHAVNLEAYGQYGDINVFAALDTGLNRQSVFPGLRAELHRFPLDLVIGLPISVSARAGVWLQPRDQRFETSSHVPGALGALRVAYSSSRSFEPYVEVEGKSAGWVAGQAWLGSNASVRAGLVAMLF